MMLLPPALYEFRRGEKMLPAPPVAAAAVAAAVAEGLPVTGGIFSSRDGRRLGVGKKDGSPGTASSVRPAREFGARACWRAVGGVDGEVGACEKR